MSLGRYVEIDGKVHDITDLPVLHRSRCDGCGEFAEADAPVIVQGMVMIAGKVTDSFQLDLHPECADRKLPFLAGRLARKRFASE